jgi:hypothetical protein
MSDLVIDFQRAESELVEAGNAIRQLKADMKVAAKKGADDDADFDLLIQERVRVLNNLKERYCEVVIAEIERLESSGQDVSKQDIARLEQLLPSAAAKQRKTERRKKNKQQTAANEKRFDVRDGIEGVKCQRKIHSLLYHEGTSDTFRYFPKLNDTAAFCEGDVVFLTEKIDGTTMQATNGGVYKRFDRKSARKSGKWHNLTDEERYSVERVDLSNRSNRYIAQAVQDYLPIFSQIPDGVCIYFEAIGQSIGARFAEISEFSDTIYVFDSTRDGEFVPFGDTVELCERVSLPCVAHSTTELSVSNIIETLSRQPLYYSALPTALLEGFVVRSTTSCAAAKIRVDDVPKICYRGDECNCNTNS